MSENTINELQAKLLSLNSELLQLTLESTETSTTSRRTTASVPPTEAELLEQYKNQEIEDAKIRELEFDIHSAIDEINRIKTERGINI